MLYRNGNLGNGLYLDRELGAIGNGSNGHVRTENPPVMSNGTNGMPLQLRFQPGQPYTLSCFVKLDDFISQSFGLIGITSCGSVDFSTIYNMQLYNRYLSAQYTWSPVDYRRFISNTTQLQTNTIYHLVIISNGNYTTIGDTSTFKCYVNNILQSGVYDGVGVVPTQVDYDRLPDSVNYVVGGFRASPNGFNPTGITISYPMKGTVYNHSIFNKMLSEQEISHLYKFEGNIPESARPNMVLDLRFDNSEGNIIRDYSIYNAQFSAINFNTKTNLGGGAWRDGYTGLPIVY